ncbi:DUF4179 domain-containing protein [Clostridium paraputrificum]|uniref:DUF4179 domain-containing protein n=1 Tax=Clostridium paraputrificum TaxID=29363 RepID=UPI003D34E370
MDKFDEQLRRMSKESKVEPPVELREKVNNTCKDIKRGKGILRRIGAIAAVSTIAVFTFGISFPVYANQIPVVGRVIGYFNEQFGKEGYKEQAQAIGYTVEAGDYTINIEDIYYDDIEMNIFYTVKSDKPLDLLRKYWLNLKVRPDFDINYEGFLEEGSLIDDYTFAGMMTYNISPTDGSKLPEILKGTLDVNKLMIGYGESEEIPVKGEPLKLELKNKGIPIEEYEINKTVIANGNSIEFLKVRKFPTRVIIDTKESTTGKNNSLQYYLWNSKQGKLGAVFGGVKGDIYSSQHSLPSTGGETYIIPIVDRGLQSVKDVKQSNQYLLEKGKKYNFNDNESIEIEDIKYEEDRTLVTARVVGYNSLWNFSVEEDISKEGVYSAYEADKEVLGILDKKVTYVLPKLDENKKYYMDCNYASNNYTILTDEIIKLDIK